MKLNDFHLLKEDQHSFTIGHPQGKSMTVPKAGLSEKAHGLIKGLKPVQHFDEGGGVQSDNVQDSPEQIASDAAAQSPAQQAAPTASSPTAQDESNSTDEPAQQAAPQSPMAQQISGSEAAFNAEEAASKAQANAVSGQGAAESKALQSTIDAQANLPKLAELQAAQKVKDDSFMQQLQSQKIDPNRFINNMSTGQKILSGIGMVLGGIGSARTGQPNYAYQNLQNHINNDIESQKNDQSKTMNMWKMNREAYGSDVAANLATQNQLNTVLQFQLSKASSQFKGPQAQANSQMAIAQIEQQKAQNRLKLSMMSPTSDAPDPATRVPFLVPPAQQQKAFDEIDAAKATAQNGPEILKSFDRAANNYSHATDYNPFIDNADQKSLHALMGPTFKDVEGTVRQAAMDNMAKNTTPQFGDDQNTIDTKRAALIGYLRSKAQSSSTNKGFGIDLSKFQSTNFNPSPATPAPVPRQTQSGKIGLFDPNTKKFLGYK